MSPASSESRDYPQRGFLFTPEIKATLTQKAFLN
jgi:hypothetical protein